MGQAGGVAPLPYHPALGLDGLALSIKKRYENDVLHSDEILLHSYALGQWGERLIRLPAAKSGCKDRSGMGMVVSFAQTPNP